VEFTHNIKEQVAEFWDRGSCGISVTAAEKYSRQYFDEIEEYRYQVEAEIFSFAQFIRYHGKRVLEVGIGAGTDFLQWIRAGAEAYGIDLTEESVRNVQQRLSAYGMKAADVRVSDAENLPYQDNFFDLVYSWGVIHHTENTIKALEEIIRVAKPGGAIKIMVYNRRSVVALQLYLQYGLLRGKPFRSISDILWHHQESIGTKAYTIEEMKNILSRYPVVIRSINAKVTSYDLQWNYDPKVNKNGLVRRALYSLACILGFNRCGWFLTIDIRKEAA